MNVHARSDVYATQVLLAANRAAKDGTVVQQLQKFEAHKKAQICDVMMCLILSHFHMKEHDKHATKFE